MAFLDAVRRFLFPGTTLSADILDSAGGER